MAGYFSGTGVAHYPGTSPTASTGAYGVARKPKATSSGGSGEDMSAQQEYFDAQLRIAQEQLALSKQMAAQSLEAQRAQLAAMAGLKAPLEPEKQAADNASSASQDARNKQARRRGLLSTFTRYMMGDQTGQTTGTRTILGNAA